LKEKGTKKNFARNFVSLRLEIQRSKKSVGKENEVFRKAFFGSFFLEKRNKKRPSKSVPFS